MRKKVAVLLSAVLIFSGCASGEKGMEQNTETKEEISIGVCFDTFTIERWLKDRDVFTYTATEQGAKVEVQNANGDVEKQREQIEHFIDCDVDALVIVAVDGSRLTDLLEKAHHKGIKLVAYDRLIVDAPIDLYLSFDNYAVGSMMAEAIWEAKGSGSNVLVISGPETDQNVHMVLEGFKTVAEEKELRIVNEAAMEGWRTENVDLYFSEHPEALDGVDAVMCGNDSLAGEVIQRLAERQLAGSIIVTGQDADLEACQHIVEGTQQMTVYKPVEQLAKQAAERTLQLVKNESAALTDTDRIENGTGEIPYVALKPVAVDKENMDTEIIESGFHLKEDVYANVSQALP